LQRIDTINTENCIFEYIDFEGNIAIEVSKILHKHQVQSVIGRWTTNLANFIDADVWDEARIFKGTVLIENGIKAPDFILKNTSLKQYIKMNL
jgi:diaminohydroxyphosphoribosylaminopyrimidine deaminase/5-amino-6-(5-phosphoribosylamino)uracil reductase